MNATNTNQEEVFTFAQAISNAVNEATVEVSNQELTDEMKEFEKALVQDLIDTKQAVQESANELLNFYYMDKVTLLGEIQELNITDVAKAQKFLEIIEFVRECDKNGDTDYGLSFYEGIISLTAGEGCHGNNFEIDFANGEFLIDGENLSEYDFVGVREFDDVESLLTAIDFKVIVESECECE